MKTHEIRKLFIDYFTRHNHTLVASSPLIPHNDDTLLFTNSGMVQFKNVFTGLESKDFKKVVTVQKCLRAGGKHNDLDNVGYTARHHTFFEMLGNFSFGDYFKKDAIHHAWIFLTEILAIPKDKLIVTIYHTDDETYKLWQEVAGLSNDKIIRISTEDNFWEMGEFGPCGPCTEIFYDHGEHIYGGLPGSATEDGDRYVEIWNLVFMQYEKLQDGTMIALKKPCIDTGMGIERISAVKQNVIDNYDTDIFKALIENIQSILTTKVTPDNKPAFKVIADHIRSVSFMIIDGITPSNEGRGYVLRRIIRRAVRYAYMLGAKEPILYKLVPTLKNQMGKDYKELVIREELIFEVIKQEEQKFHETFANGIKILNDEITKLGSLKVLDGKIAFKLYDTYGFPIDLTEDVLKTKNIHLDKEGFNKAFKHHKNLAKNTWQGSGENKDDNLWFTLASKLPSTIFTGYESLQEEGELLSIITLGSDNKLVEVSNLQEGQEGYIITNKTPFYAEMGGQIGDKGFIVHESNTYKDSTNIENSNNNFIAKVITTTKKAEKLFAHKVIIEQGSIFLSSGKPTILFLEVNKEFRKQISSNHSGAHLLACALRKHLGHHITQQGSMVSENRLRFDISHNKPITADEIEKIEKSINTVIIHNYPVFIENMKLEKAIADGAIAMLGEEYPKIVRTVKFGEDSTLLSFELCGGTHVTATAEVGTFKIIGESSIASGIRRIEAVCGLKALDYYNSIDGYMKKLSTILNVEKEKTIEKVGSILETNKKLKKDYNLMLRKYHATIAYNTRVKLGEISFIDYNVNTKEAKDLRDIASYIVTGKPSLIALVYIFNDGKINFVVCISKDIAKTLDKDFVKKILKDCKATGGGSAEIFQGSLDKSMLEKMRSILKELNS